MFAYYNLLVLSKYIVFGILLLYLKTKCILSENLIDLTKKYLSLHKSKNIF